jgi:PKD repeat protein
MFLLTALSVVALSAQADTYWGGSLPDLQGSNNYEPDDPTLSTRVQDANGYSELVVTAQLADTVWREAGGYYDSQIVPLICVDTLGSVGYNVVYDFNIGPVGHEAIGAPTKWLQPDLRNNQGVVVEFPRPSMYEDRFSFPYFGLTYDSFYLHENGYITFGMAVNDRWALPQQSYPNPSAKPDGIVAPLWMDISMVVGEVWCGFSSNSWYQDVFSIIWQGVSSSGGDQSFMMSLREDGAIVIEYGNLGTVSGASVGYENLDATKGGNFASAEVCDYSRFILAPTPGSYQYVDHIGLTIDKLTSTGSRDTESVIEYLDPELSGNLPFPGLNVYTLDAYAPTPPDNPNLDKILNTIAIAVDVANFLIWVFLPEVGITLEFLGVLVDVLQFALGLMPEYTPEDSTWDDSPLPTPQDPHDHAATANLLACDWAANPEDQNRPVPKEFFCFPIVSWRIYDSDRSAVHRLTIDVNAHIIDGSRYNPLNPNANYDHQAYDLVAQRLEYKFNSGDADIHGVSPSQTGLTYTAGSTYPITWVTNAGAGSLVDIDLYSVTVVNSQEVYTHVCQIADDAPNSGSYSWTLPTNLAAGPSFKIKVSSKWMVEVDSTKVSAMSTKAFAITNPYIYLRVTSPNGGELLWANGYLYATFTSGGISQFTNVRGSLYKGEALVVDLGLSAVGAGWFGWTISDTIATGTDYRIKVAVEGNPSIYDFSDGYFKIGNDNDAWFRITDPNGGEYYLPGDTIYITWQSGNILTGGVNLLLYEGGTATKSIAYGAPNTGSYAWTIPTNKPTFIGGPDCLIYIYGTDSHYYYVQDFSDAYFELDDSWIDVYSPDAGTYVNPGGECFILWQNNQYPGDSFVNIDLFKGGVLDRPVAASVSNNQLYEWTVPSDLPIGTDYTIEVSSTTKAAKDMSEAFTITSFVVTSPNGGESFPGGTAIPVTWTCAYPPPTGTALVELYKGSTRVGYFTTENDGVSGYTLPTTMGSDYRIRVAVYGEGIMLGDISDGYFSVTAPAILSLTSPNGGEVWSNGVGVSVHYVSWTSANFNSGLDIYLLKDNEGLSWQVADNTPNDGSFQLDVSNRVYGTDYNVYIVGSDWAYQMIMDWSDGYFTIDPAPTMPGIPHLQTPGDEVDGTYTVTWDAAVDNDPTPLAYYYLIERTKTGGVWGGWSGISQTLTTNSYTLTRGPGEYQYGVCAGDTADFWTSWALMPWIPVTQSIIVPGPLQAAGSASATSGVVPLTVSFTCTASGGVSPYTYSWVFGDGGTSSEQNPTHIYYTPGIYVAIVTVTDSASQTAQWSSPEINAIMPLYVLMASVNPISGTAPLTVSFSITPDGGTTPYSYYWTFGDGGTSTLRNPTHVYSVGGTYTATCLITDSGSQSTTWTSPPINVANPQLYQLTVNGGYYNSRGVWQPLTGTVWIDSVSVGTTGQTFVVTAGTHVVQVQDPIVYKGKTYSFMMWQGGTPSANPGSITISADRTITAVYAIVVRYTLDISVNNAAWGYTDPSGTQTCDGGSSVTVTAYPSVGYVLSHWLLDGVQKSGNPYTVTMNADHVLQAVFQPQGVQTYTLTVNSMYFSTTWKPFTGAWVKIDGVTVGVSGGTFTVTAGSHVVQIQGTYTIKGKVLSFQYWWMDIPLGNPGTLDVQSNMVITAYYSR